MPKASPKAANWPATPLGRERRKLLKIRIAACMPWPWVTGRKEPAAVTKARKLIESYDKQERTMAESMRQEAKAAALDADRDVLFAPDANAALKAVEKFEAMAKRKGWKKSAGQILE